MDNDTRQFFKNMNRQERRQWYKLNKKEFNLPDWDTFNKSIPEKQIPYVNKNKRRTA